MKNDDVTQKINVELEALQNKMKNTIKEEEERGASLQHLGKQTESLEQRAHVFEHTAEQTEWKMWFKAFKWYAIGGFIVCAILFILYRIV